MQDLIQPQIKQNIAINDELGYHVNEKSNNLKPGLEYKFYQKLFVIFFILCAFLIFPESPQDSETLCRKYNSSDACVVW